MKIGVAILSLLSFTILITQYAFGASLSTWINPSSDNSKFFIDYQRTIFIEYENGSQLAEQLQGKNLHINASGNTTDVEVKKLIEQLNQQIASDGSNASITGLSVGYDANLIGRSKIASIDYKISFEGVISNYTIHENLDTALVDIEWLGLTVEGPIEIKGVEINLPISLIKENEPEIYEKILGTEIENLFLTNLINASGIKASSHNNWHFRLNPEYPDPTKFGLPYDESNPVVSIFIMGQCNLRGSSCGEHIDEVRFTIDKEYVAKVVEERDSLLISVLGFGKITTLDGNKFIEINHNKSEITPGKQILYGILRSNIVCKEGLVLFFKTTDISPACVNPETAEKLVERRWAYSQDTQMIQKLKEAQDVLSKLAASKELGIPLSISYVVEENPILVIGVNGPLPKDVYYKRIIEIVGDLPIEVIHATFTPLGS